MTKWCDKHQHGTAEQARDQLRSLKRSGHMRGATDRFNVYRCPICDFWHIGHNIGRGKRS